MEEESKEIIVLGAIKKGIKKFDKIQKAAHIDSKELDEILEKLEKKEFIKVEEKKGWLGKKIEIRSTDKGDREVDQRVHELQTKWSQMSTIYKTGNKEKMKGIMDDNKTLLPMMMFFGVMDLMMFSMMFSMMGASMGDYVPAEDMPTGMDDSSGMDGTDGEGFNDGGFDFDIGF